MRHETVRDVRGFAEQKSPKLVETKPSQASTSLNPALRIMSDGREDLQTSFWIARARSATEDRAWCAIPTSIPEAIDLDHLEPKKTTTLVRIRPELWFSHFGTHKKR